MQGNGALETEMEKWGSGEWGKREGGRRREREKGRTGRGGERAETERRRGGGCETGCLQLSCGSVVAEPPASVAPTRACVAPKKWCVHQHIPPNFKLLAFANGYVFVAFNIDALERETAVAEGSLVFTVRLHIHRASSIPK